MQNLYPWAGAYSVVFLTGLALMLRGHSTVARAHAGRIGALIGTVVIGYGLPHLIAWWEGVDTWDGVRDAFCAPEKLQALDAVTRATHQEWCQYAVADAPFPFSGFLGNAQQFMHAWMLLLLGVLLLYRSPASAPDHQGKAFALSALLFPLLRGFHLYRLLPFMQEQRKIVSYAHHDVSTGSALCNDVLFFCFLFVLMLICLRWLASDSPEQAQQNDMRAAYAAVEQAYANWRVDSVLLGAAFLYLTFVYWNIILVRKDLRYVPSAVLVHLLWAASWVCISTPFYRRWRVWRTLRLQKVLEAPSAGTLEASVIMGLHPIAAWSFVSSAAAATLSFLAPFITKWLGP